jgi:hypothetical protein
MGASGEIWPDHLDGHVEGRPARIGCQQAVRLELDCGREHQ